MKTDEVEGLLQAERGRSGFSQEQRAAMWKGIASTIGPLGSAGPADAPPKDKAPESPSSPAPGAAAPSAAATSLSLKIGALVAVAALGGGIGAAAHARWAEPRVIVESAPSAAVAPAPTGSVAITAPGPSGSVAITVPAPSGSVAIAAPAPQASLAPTSPANGGDRAAPSHVVTSAAPSASAPARDPGLARERMLLDMARTALSRGDAAAALSAIDTHAHDFPSSQLGEEREVLAVQALAAANRLPEARSRAARFRVSYPKSALLPIVDESTQ